MSDVSEWRAYPPAAFDIVACWYPERETPEKPGPVLRPALVTKVLRSKNLGLFACEVVFGTKHLKVMQRLNKDIIVQNSDDIAQLGLYRATRFDLDYHIKLPWTEEYFGCWDGYSSPVLGSMTESYIREYAFLMMRRLSTGG